MKAICKFLGYATLLFGLFVWLSTPVYPVYEPESHAVSMVYSIAAGGCFVGGFF